jgi:hypothetical protein
MKLNILRKISKVMFLKCFIFLVNLPNLASAIHHCNMSLKKGKYSGLDGVIR